MVYNSIGGIVGAGVTYGIANRTFNYMEGKGRRKKRWRQTKRLKKRAYRRGRRY